MIYNDNYCKNHDFIMIIMTNQRPIYLSLLSFEYLFSQNRTTPFLKSFFTQINILIATQTVFETVTFAKS